MRQHSFLLGLTILFVSLTSADANSAEPGKLLPSEAITLMLTEGMDNPQASREDVYKELLPRVIVSGLDDDEQFFLGEVYFFVLMPEEAREAYVPLMDGGSMRSRVASQRMLQVYFRAFENYEKAAAEMLRFREKFAPDPRDRDYLATQVINFGNYYAGEGRHQEVVDGIEAELAALNYDGAYRSHTLPARFIDSYVAVNEKQKALDHLLSAREGLSKTLMRRESNKPESDYSYPLPSPDHLWYFFTGMNEKFGWQQQNDNLRQMIDELAESIENIQAI